MRIMLIFALLFTSLNDQDDTNSENVLNFVFEDQISFMINDEKIESEYSLEGYLTESSSGILIDLYSITIDGTAFEFEQKISTNYTFLEFKENQKTNPLIKENNEAAEEVVEEAAEEVVEEAAEEVVEEAAEEVVEENENIYPTKLMADIEPSDIHKWLEPINLMFSIFKNIDLEKLEKERVFQQDFKSGYWKSVWMPQQDSIQIDISGVLKRQMHWPPTGLPFAPLLFLEDEVSYEIEGGIEIKTMLGSNEILDIQFTTQKKIDAPWSESINGEREIRIKILKNQNE